MNIWWQNILLH